MCFLLQSTMISLESILFQDCASTECNAMSNSHSSFLYIATRLFSIMYYFERCVSQFAQISTEYRTYIERISLLICYCLQWIRSRFPNKHLQGITSISLKNTYVFQQVEPDKLELKSCGSYCKKTKYCYGKSKQVTPFVNFLERMALSQLCSWNEHYFEKCSIRRFL